MYIVYPPAHLRKRPQFKSYNVLCVYVETRTTNVMTNGAPGKRPTLIIIYYEHEESL